MMCYASRYLNVYPSKQGTTILFHGVTGAIDEVDQALGVWLKKAQREGTILDQCYGDDTVAFLAQRGHVTSLPPEEELRQFKSYVEQLHAKICQDRKQSGSLMLVPSYYCNLACFYCYQNPMRAAEGQSAAQVMTAEMVDVIFARVLPMLYPEVPRLSRISVNLYGGEPFLDRNRAALERIFDYTQQHQMDVSAISNATTLHAFLPYFGNAHGLVRSLQISFDGHKLAHDQSRITHYGDGTFDQIIDNIHRLLDQGVRINLRTNTTKANVDSLQLLWNHLQEEEITTHPNVTMYAAAVHNHFEQTDPEPLFSPATLTRHMEKRQLPMSSPLDKKVSRLTGVFDAESGIPLNRTNFCMQNMPNAFLIDQRRDIYSCYEEAGNRHLRVGYFAEAGEITMLERYQLYQSRHIGMIDPCSKCSVALTCGGGCPVAARGKNWTTGTIFTNHCDSHRELVAMAMQKIFAERTAGPRAFAEQSEDAWLQDRPYL